ncbi:hypothetical protein VB711_08165 [Cronbergia sp. UHCC 0137]|uniref:hypothetical protein n=1 Tax=Cronbergia sp. UHCC 0137 TaxID=3110239 RepID=UPI002B21EBFB|nr:hypothetical protein [Cronbergia sp. UHCC 0137]MEA5617811.1 hypothetical protein [Cronbergia sp. UHCC 0137]
MDSLEKQILNLSDKVDAVYRVIEKLDLKVSQALSEGSLDRTMLKDSYRENNEVERYNFKGNLSFNSQLEHKDILVDGIYLDINPQSGDKQITPEIQIQRLTAQLTAAYHRIAALEEQLLRERIS